MTDLNDNSYFQSFRLTDFVYRNRMLLAIIAIASAILASVFSLMIKDKYQANVVLFPASSTSVSEALVSNSGSPRELLKFGTAEEVEQFMQVLYSDEIREKICEKYDLYDHYKIDENKPYPRTRLMDKYEENITFRRTEYLSVVIEVLDEDPQIAANIANDIADYSDSTISRMQKDRAMQAYEIVKNEYEEAVASLKMIDDSLRKLREMGIYDYEAQIEVYSDAYATALAKGNFAGKEEFEKKFEVLAKYGGYYTSLSEMHITETRRLSDLKKKYVEAKVDAEQNLPHKYIVSRAYPPEKEKYPIRWLIVLGAVTAALLFGSLVIASFEASKKKIVVSIDLKKIKFDNVLFNYDIMEGYFNNKSFVKVISRWKIHLAVVVVVSAGLGVLFSSEIFITPLYKSTAVVYPVNLYEYSEESTTEQMLQVFRSDDLKKQMLESFDLGKHYELDPKDPHFFTYFMGEYDSHVSVSKTEYESVEITVKDKNPQQASDMVDSLITFFDRKVSVLHQRKQKEVMEIALNDLYRKKHKMDSLDFVLCEMRKQYGILSYPNQIEDATKAYLNGGGNKTAQDFYKNLQEKGAEFQKMDSLAWYARRDYLYVQNEYETALKEYNKKISYTQVVSSPYPADKKSYPVRWFIVMITTVVSFLSALIVIAFIESKRTPS